MNALRSLVAELVGLFVEDRFFALAVAAWIALMIATAPLWNGSSFARGITLFFGLAVILMGSVISTARKR